MLHVILFGPVPPPHGGVEVHLMRLRDFLRSQGVRVSVINITRHRRRSADDIYYPSNAAEILRLVARLKGDILHVHLGGMLNRRVLALCLVCAAVPGARSVLTFHSGGYPSSDEGRATRTASFAGFVLRRMDHLIGVNKEIGAFYKQAGARDARVSVIEPHDFTGGTALQAVPDHITKFTERHDPLLLCVAQLEPEYEVPLQIRTMPRILDEHPRAGLVILGSGTCEADLRELIASSPCADHILLGGDLTHGATLSAIRDSDVLLRTTRYDGDALSVREALHLGTRVLATDNGMRPPGVSLLPSLDEAALSIAVRTVLSGPRPAPVAAEDGNFARVLKLYQRLR